MAKVVDFFSKHLVVAALFVSSLWFYGGYQYIVKKKLILGLSWQLIGVAVLVAFCVNALLSESWPSLAIAIGTIIVELLLIRRYRRERYIEHN